MTKSATLPNLLTLSRIVMVPVVVGLFYLNDPLGNVLAAIIFMAACITDYLDGYFARLWQQTSNLGTFLDPMADKLLVAATILMLTGFGRISGIHLIPAVVILCREVLVSGLREFLADIRVNMPVTNLAKWKTGIQMTALGLLIIKDIPVISTITEGIGIIGLWIAAILTMVTGFDYLKASFRHFD